MRWLDVLAWLLPGTQVVGFPARPGPGGGCQAAEEQRTPQVLLQVKLRPDPSKGGFEPQELLRDWPQLQQLAPLQITGLMTIAPLVLELQERRSLFQDCAALAGELGLHELSMGMSGDWREAAASGSTWVRIGSALFGERQQPARL